MSRIDLKLAVQSYKRIDLKFPDKARHVLTSCNPGICEDLKFAVKKFSILKIS
jgi:hypothetical protein